MTHMIEQRLRDLAACFTGTRMSHRLPKRDRQSSRDLGVTFVDLETGEDKDVGEELLAIADEIAMLTLPKPVRPTGAP